MAEAKGDVDITVLEGWLKKKAGGKKTWGASETRRWFKVQQTQGSEEDGELALCYYKTAGSTEPRGWVFLKDVVEVREERYDKSVPTMVIIHPSRTMRLTAKTRAEHRLWFSGIKALCAASPADAAEPREGRPESSSNGFKQDGPKSPGAKPTLNAFDEEDEDEVPARDQDPVPEQAATDAAREERRPRPAPRRDGRPQHIIGTSATNRLHTHISQRAALAPGSPGFHSVSDDEPEPEEEEEEDKEGEEAAERRARAATRAAVAAEHEAGMAAAESLRSNRSIAETKGGRDDGFDEPKRERRNRPPPSAPPPRAEEKLDAPVGKINEDKARRGPIGRHHVDMEDPDEAEEELFLEDHAAPATSPHMKIAARQGFMSPAERAAFAAEAAEATHAGDAMASQAKDAPEEPEIRRKPPPRRLADEVDEVAEEAGASGVAGREVLRESKPLAGFDSDSGDEEDLIAQEKQRLSEKLDAKPQRTGDGRKPKGKRPERRPPPSTAPPRAAPVAADADFLEEDWDADARGSGKPQKPSVVKEDPNWVDEDWD